MKQILPRFKDPNDKFDYHTEKQGSPTGCWTWRGFVHPDGYGYLWANGKSWRAPRYSYTRFNGEIPENTFVCHTCDNMLCVNPKHLFLGTRQDNIDDMCAKGRAKGAVGNNNVHAILTEDQVIEIRNSYVKSPGALTKLATEYGVDKQVITRLLSRKTWKHI